MSVNTLHKGDDDDNNNNMNPNLQLQLPLTVLLLELAKFSVPYIFVTQATYTDV
jgi:hypothetical protein